MQPWLEALGVLAVALAGAYAGVWFSRRRSPYWLIGWILPFAMIFVVTLTRWIPSLTFAPPLYWAVAGRTKFVVLAGAASMVLMTPRSRLRNKRERTWLAVLTAFAVGYAASPFFAEALVRPRLLQLETRVNKYGVCIQSNGYTCGPAAAVTGLLRLGLPAEESELAILAHTTPTGGTSPDCLVSALEERYGKDGLSAEYRHLGDLRELASVLAGGAEVIAVVKYAFLIDHYVAVLEVNGEQVIVGDPLSGKKPLSHADFLERWRRLGIIVRMSG